MQAALYSDLGVLIMPHVQVAFIRLKQEIYAKFVQLREFGESILEHLQAQTSQTKIKEGFKVKMLKCCCKRPIILELQSPDFRGSRMTFGGSCH